MAPVRVTRAGLKPSALPKLTGLPTFGGSKRSAAERSPQKKPPTKRAALGDVTNREPITTSITADLKKTIADRNPVKKLKKKRTTYKPNASNNTKTDSDETSSSQDSTKSDENAFVSCSNESAVKISAQKTEKEKKETVKKETEKKKEEKGEEETKEDVFHDAVETLSPTPSNQGDVDDSILLLSVGPNVAKNNERNIAKTTDKEVIRVQIEDVDEENKHDPYLVPNYAQDIFKYYMDREAKFKVADYMKEQTDISFSMRAIVVDWMVEVQENFELNHETLYMATRLVDLYLTKQKVSRDKLQLVAATALFIACKFDERIPPVLDDFLYVCDDAYKREEYIRMEMAILKVMDFDIGMPSSYRFLRRYAKCGKIGLDTLTLSRYILETSQMEYEYLSYKDSQLAAACLLLAMKMKKMGEWTPTLKYYSTYGSDELMPLVAKLNKMISLPPYKNLQTIKTKYSHKVFFEVAKTQPLDQSTFES